MTPPSPDPRDVVAAFFDGLVEDPSDARYAELTLMHPGAAYAALGYLRARYVDGVAAVEPWERVGACDDILCLMLGRGGPSAQDALVALALEAGDLADLRALGAMVSAVVDADRLARALIAALNGDERVRVRASELAYHTFDASAGALAPHPDLEVVLAEKLRQHHRAEARRATSSTSGAPPGSRTRGPGGSSS